MKYIFKFNALATLFALSLTLASLNVNAADMAAATAAHEKVVFQVSDAGPGKWNLTLNNAKNVQDAVGKNNVDIEIVAFGPGIEMLKRESEVGSKIDKALADGIKVVACENTMKAMKLTKADMLPTIGYVPGGVVELMKKQKEDWSYIRP